MEKRFDIVVAARDAASAVFSKIGQAYDSLRGKLNSGGSGSSGGGGGGGGWSFERQKEEGRKRQQEIIDGTDQKRGPVGSAMANRFLTIGGFEMVGRGLNKALGDLTKNIVDEGMNLGQALAATGRNLMETVPVFGQFFQAGQKIRGLIDGSAAEAAQIEKETASREKQFQRQLDGAKERDRVSGQIRNMMQGIGDEARLTGKSGIGLEQAQAALERDRSLREVRAMEEQSKAAAKRGGFAFDGSEFDTARSAIMQKWERERDAIFAATDAKHAEITRRELEREEQATQRKIELQQRQAKERERHAREQEKKHREMNASFFRADSELFEAQKKAEGKSLEAQQEAVRRSFDERINNAKSAQERQLLAAQERLALSQLEISGAHDARSAQRGGVNLGPSLNSRFSGRAEAHDPGLSAMMKVSDNTKKMVEEIAKLRAELANKGLTPTEGDIVL